jgi:hypothetical protein
MICFIDAIGMSVRSRGLTECFGSAILVLDFPPYFNLSGEISAREAIGQPPLTEASFKKRTSTSDSGSKRNALRFQAAHEYTA